MLDLKRQVLRMFHPFITERKLPSHDSCDRREIDGQEMEEICVDVLKYFARLVRFYSRRAFSFMHILAECVSLECFLRET